MVEKVGIKMQPLDTSDTDKWVGRPIGGGQLKEPITLNDIRRWAQGMQNPNPLYYDERYAAQSALGEIIAPQSFTVNCTVGLGTVPAIQGNIPGTHMLFGGDEWWFYGPRIRPGDKIRSERMLFDYRVSNTKFAGPTMFARGDTTYINHRGEVIAKGRCTAIRYRAENARAIGSFTDQKMRRNEEPGRNADDKGVSRDQAALEVKYEARLRRHRCAKTQAAVEIIGLGAVAARRAGPRIDTVRLETRNW